MFPPIPACSIGFQTNDTESDEISCSGVFISNSVIIAPACILANANEGQIRKGTFTVTYSSLKGGHEIQTCNAELVLIWTCNELKSSLDLLFQDKDVTLFTDKQEKTRLNLLSKFVLIRLSQSHVSEVSLNLDFSDSIQVCNAYVGDRLQLCSTPFGRTNPEVFMNTWTTGIVANQLDGKSLLLCDMSCVPGCQGGIIYKLCKTSQQLCAAAVVLHPITWRYEEPSGLCVAGSLQTVLNSLKKALMESEMRLLDFSLKVRPCDDREATKHEYFKSIVRVVMKSNWGTGVLLSNRYVLTCAHVIKGHQYYSPKIKHNSADECFTSSVVYCSENTDEFDVAILRLHEKLPITQDISLTIAGSMRVGERVLACGYGIFKDQPTPVVTSGILSKISHSKRSVMTSCHVHSGSSGGAVINSRGEIVALVIAHVLNDTQGIVYTNISFGIPLMLLKNAIADLTERDSVNGFLALSKLCTNKTHAKL